MKLSKETIENGNGINKIINIRSLTTSLLILIILAVTSTIYAVKSNTAEICNVKEDQKEAKGERKEMREDTKELKENVNKLIVTLTKLSGELEKQNALAEERNKVKSN